jgi:hypothetical protein
MGDRVGECFELLVRFAQLRRALLDLLLQRLVEVPHRVLRELARGQVEDESDAGVG